jgi:hypothetical protein
MDDHRTMPRRLDLATVRRTLKLTALVLVLGSMMLVNTGAGAQYVCPRAADPAVQTGWAFYRAGDIPGARQAFEEAVGRCPNHIGGTTGLGYVELRQGNTAEAGALFDAVLSRDPDVIDALVGRGMVAWRDGDLGEVEERFARVLQLEPGHVEALRYLERLEPEPPEPIAPAPERPPLELPDTVEHRVRARAAGFEIRTADGWEPVYVKGINLGAALPGRHPTQFPDSAVYAGWLEQMGETGANAIRVYTRHPPAFYSALLEYNTAHPDRPLWLIQGVWAVLPPNGVAYDDPVWESDFLDDIGHTVDIIHGRADITPQPGMAGGHYVADVAPWTLAIVLGREWEASSVVGFNELRPEFTRWEGEFARIENASPMETWLTRIVDAAAAYESRTYHAQRPVSFTSWPTADPLRHPTEATSVEEAEIRRSLGEQVGAVPLEGEDAVSIDPGLLETTGRFPAGFFATYHVYPYYPDFMNLDPGYREAVSPYGPSSYWGYLTDLKRHHADLPVLIAEYGLPSSIGVSHVNGQGWHHGGLTEEEAAAGTARMTREIAAAGMAGGVVFEWIDEWFKRTWVTYQFESPRERDPVWYNRLDSEEHYGMIAVEPAPRLPGRTLEERVTADWPAVPAAYDDPQRGTLRLIADEAYLRVLYRTADVRPEEIVIGFDVIDPDRGDTRWPGRAGPRLPVGLEVVLRVAGDTARILQDTYSQPYELRELPATGLPIDSGPDVPSPPRGFFRGRLATVGSLGIYSRPNDDGVYEAPRLIFSRRVFGRDSTEFAALGYDSGILPRGAEPDGLWGSDGTAFEFRIPWQLLNVGDPSRRMVLQDTVRAWRGGALDAVPVEAVRVVAASRTGGSWTSLPASGLREDVASFTWPTWDTPEWRTRPRPLVEALRSAWSSIDQDGDTPDTVSESAAP